MTSNQNYENHENSNYQALYAVPEQPRDDRQSAAGRKHKKSGIVALALCCSLLGGACGAGGVLAGSQLLSAPTTVAEVAATGTNLASTAPAAAAMTASQVYEQNVGSTVGITTSISTNYFGYQTISAASGSGFIISEDGYILTNQHVIDNAQNITVTTYDGTQYPATLVGSYAANDIAVLKIAAEHLTPVTLGSSDGLSVGEQVVAIGNPLGELTFSLTSGVVSALNRAVTTENGTMNLIQTDCAINSGNSGGALFNMQGEVIGITNAKYATTSTSEASIDNIGFAIPVDQIRTMITSIIEKGYISKPFIGVSVTDVNAEMTAYGIPAGAVVKEVTEDSPAAAAGLAVNDIITAADGKDITGSNDLVSYVKQLEKGDELKLTVYRSGEEREVSLTIEETQISALEEAEAEAEEQTEANPGYQQYFDYFSGMYR